MRILPKKDVPDYENTKLLLEKLIHAKLDEVDHDIMMEKLYDWLEYTHKLEEDLQQLRERVEVIQEVVGFPL